MNTIATNDYDDDVSKGIAEGKSFWFKFGASSPFRVTATPVA